MDPTTINCLTKGVYASTDFITAWQEKLVPRMMRLAELMGFTSEGEIEALDVLDAAIKALEGKHN